jgi:hypothetical protein
LFKLLEISQNFSDMGKIMKPHKAVFPVNQDRGADRFDTELPVDMSGAKGLTRNISATGVYFETQGSQEPGSRVNFTVEVTVRGEVLKLVCEGEVVRVDRKNGVTGIAAKLGKSFFTNVATS